MATPTPNPLDFLNPLNLAAQAAKTLVDVWYNVTDRKERENTSIAADLMAVLEELGKTHSTIVKLVSPLRRIPDDLNTFSNDFGAVYNDFRDVYDAKDWVDERTRCHKIGQIRNRLQNRKPRFGSDAQWQELDAQLMELSNADFNIIDRQYKPFMEWFNEVMEDIKKEIAAVRI